MSMLLETAVESISRSPKAYVYLMGTKLQIIIDLTKFMVQLFLDILICLQTILIYPE